jgi:hypothetical protein
MAKVKHPDTRKGYESRMPGGTPSSALEATPVGPPVEQPRKAVTPRQDPDDQEKYHRGASMVGKGVRRRKKSPGAAPPLR